MSIQSNGLKILQSAAGWANLSYPELTTSFFVRVDAKEGTGGRQFVVQSNNQYYFYVGNNHETYDATGSMPTASNYWNEATAANLPLGAVFHVLLSYSSTDPSRCFMSVNGMRYRNSLWDDFSGNLNLPAGWTLFGGGDGTASHLTIENLLIIKRALTDAEITALHYDPDGTIPTLAADVKLFYPMSGTVGDDVATGDPGISIADDATRNFEVSSGVGTLKYAEPFPRGRQVEVGGLYVTTSGRWITLACTMIGTGRQVALLPASVAAMANPVFKLNGVEITGLGAPLARPGQGGLLWRLPEGTTVVTGDGLTATYADDFVTSIYGGPAGATDRVVANRVGMPSTEPSDGLMGLGFNPTGLQASYLSAGRWPANIAKFIEFQGVRDADGSPQTPFAVSVATHGTHLNGDKYGYPRTAFIGKWAVGWDDKDHANPFTDLFLIEGTNEIAVTELTEYANVANPSTGEGRVRVYDVSARTWGGVLAAGGVDAAATTIPITAPLAPNYDFIQPPAFSWLEIDGEKILVGSVSGANFTGCTRGYMGTTAASHAGGAAVAVKSSSSGISVEIRSNHPTEEDRRFKNLQVYMPGDWDVPETPGPVTLGAPDPYKLNSNFKRNIVDRGSRVFRAMETNAVFSDGFSEVEHLPKVDDDFWAYVGRRRKWTPAKAKRFDPTGRFFYYNEEYPKTETYAATLAESIDASATSVRITTTGGERLPFGQMLLIGSERMRIAEPLPAEGDDEYVVVRAQMGTAAASHSASATITVGRRVPITDKAQYSIENITNTGKGYHYFEMVIDEVNSLCPVQNHLFSDFRGGNDVNIQARRNLTLTADFATTDSVMHVEPDSPGDWDWIATKGYVHFGGETMVVKTVDRTAGTIEVAYTTIDSDGFRSAGRTGAAGNLTTGATGTHTSGGVLFESDDGTQRMYGDFDASALSPVVMSANSMLFYIQADPHFGLGTLSWNAVADQDFVADAIVKPDQTDIHATYVPGPYLPLEFFANTCTLAGADLWLNFTYGASDAFIWDQVLLALSKLGPGLKLCVAPGNEQWHVYSPLFWASQGLARSVGLEDGARHYVMKVLHVGDVARRAAATVGRGSDVLITGEWQLGGLSLFPSLYDELEADGYDISPPLDRIAHAPYIKPSSQDKDVDFVTLCGTIDDDAELLDLQQFDFEFSDEFGPAAAYGVDARDRLNADRGWSVETCGYEGGDEAFSVIPSDAIGGSDEIRRNWFLRAVDLSCHPNARHYTRSTYEVFRRNFGFDSIALFCHARPTAANEPHYEGQQFWAPQRYQGDEPGRGDGTDGKADNTQYAFNPANPNYTDPIYDSPARHTVSPRILAYQEYQDDQRASASPFALSADGTTLTWTFAEAMTWLGDGVFTINDGASILAYTGPTGSGTTALVFTLTTPAAGSAALTIEADPGLAATVADGTPSDGYSSQAVTNNSTWTPGGGDGDGGGGVRPPNTAILLAGLC